MSLEGFTLKHPPRGSSPWNPIRKRMYMRFQLGVQHCGYAASLGAKPQWGNYFPARVWDSVPRKKRKPPEFSGGYFYWIFTDQTRATPRVTFSPLMFHSLLSSPPAPATTSSASTSPLMSFAARISAIFALPSW